MPPEQKLRTDLAHCIRLIAHFGWDDLTFSHVACRLSGESFLINPKGLLFDQVKPEDLVAVNSQGQPVGAPTSPFQPSNSKMLQATFAARPEVQCAIHLHSRRSIAVGVLPEGLRPLCQQALMIGPIGYHPYGDPSFGSRECQKLTENMTNKNIMLLQHHGLLALGESVAQAFLRAYFFDFAAQVQLETGSSGQELSLSKDAPVPRLLDDPEAVASVWNAITQKMKETQSAISK